MAGRYQDGSFRTAQAVADLVHHVGPLMQAHFGALVVVAELSPHELGAALALWRDDGFVFRQEAVLGLWGGVEVLALQGGVGFDLAVVMLLADQLQGRQRVLLLDDVWPEALARARGWPAKLRAAVVRGVVRARELGVIEIDPPDPSLGITRQADEIAEHLLQIARSMRRDEIQAVANADYGNDVERHQAALLDCIGRRDGIFEASEYWFPSEVVELSSLIPGEPGHAGCTALLLLNALHRGDEQGWFDERWVGQGAAYSALKPSQRDPILAGIRHLYETDEHFMGNSTVDFSLAGGEGRMIPVVESL